MHLRVHYIFSDMASNCLNCERSLSRLSGQIKIIRTTSEIEAIQDQLGKIAVIGDQLWDDCVTDVEGLFILVLLKKINNLKFSRTMLV